MNQTNDNDASKTPPQVAALELSKVKVDGPMSSCWGGTVGKIGKKNVLL